MAVKAKKAAKVGLETEPVRGRNKEVVASLYLSGVPTADIAAKLGVTPDAIRYLIKQVEKEIEAVSRDKAISIVQSMFLRILDANHHAMREGTIQWVALQRERDRLDRSIWQLEAEAKDRQLTKEETATLTAKRAERDRLANRLLKLAETQQGLMGRFLDQLDRVGVPEFARTHTKKEPTRTAIDNHYSEGYEDKDGVLSEAERLRLRQLREVRKLKGKKDGSD